VDTSTTVTGLFYGGGTDQLRAQFVGSLTCVIVISAVAMVLMYLVKATGTLRVSKDGELEGLDIYEHGMPPYHMEFGQGMTYSSPANLPRGDRVTVVGSRPIRTPMCQRSRVRDEDGVRTTERSNGCHSW
jgi:hypothetical protein